MPSQGWSYPYSEIYVFGDSLSDTGRFYEATGLPPAPYYKGRLSNSKLWAEMLAEHLNLTYNPQTNFAWAGATTGTANIWDERAPHATLSGLQQQIDTYIEDSTSANPNGLYIIWAGSNDFLGDTNSPEETITTAMTNLVTAVTKLRNHGAQQIMVANMPDLGKTPRGLDSGMSAVLTGLTIAFNQALAEALQPFGVIQVDMPMALGILVDPETVAPTFANLNVSEACFNQNRLSICEMPSNHFYWDDMHPTYVGHQIIALIFYSAVGEPVYFDNTQVEPLARPRLRLPAIEIISEQGKELVLDAQMARFPNETRFRFTVTGSAFQIRKFQELTTFPNHHAYPTFEPSKGILRLPVVHYAKRENVVCVAAPCDPVLNFISKYTAELSIVLQNPVNPFQAPLFVLKSAEKLND